MYDRRLKILVLIIALPLLVCVLRLVDMQLFPDASLQDAIAELTQGQSRQLQTVRGKILDRKGEVLAEDEPRFQLAIEYKLSCFLDERVRQVMLLKAPPESNAGSSRRKVQNRIEARLEDLRQIIEKCTYFGFTRTDVENKIRQINDGIWNLREYLAAKRDYPDTDFEQAVPDPNKRLLLTAKVDIVEMYKSWPLFELKTDDEVFDAQLAFMDTEAVHIQPGGHRFYPFGSVAAQTIGWVGPATGDYKKLFEDDRLASYLEDEVCGKRPGVEYVCEAILRGRRGELVRDIDEQLISRTQTEFGEDVTLTLDIELQQRIEKYLADYPHDPNCGPGMAAVIIEVASGDILAMVSMPVFDLNRIRYDYGDVAGDQNEPMRNRAIDKHYPPGSVIKPVILIAGLESGKVTPDKIIPCPAQKAPVGWPNCLIYNRHHIGHSDNWLNNAHNAVKGSCNIYFSQLADRIEPAVLQQWLLRFGYGRKIPTFKVLNGESETRGLQHAAGQISSPVARPLSNEQRAAGNETTDLPPLDEMERRLFGIGQGNLRVTPLQVANAMAAIARGGIFTQPKLFREIANFSASEQDLGISPNTLDVVYDGMSAVVNEPGGTANKEFAYSGLPEQDVHVYGKTGSTEAPEVAWFAGFAKDSNNRSIAIAVVVEGGQHGSSDAAPLARDIIQFCIETGYIGNPQR
jgi:penicillin-binding protein 2